MKLPSNTWCDGSGKAAKVDNEYRDVYATCPECGYRFRITGVVPKHRPRFNAKKEIPENGNISER